MKAFIILLLSVFSLNQAFSQETDTVYYSADEIYLILTNNLPDKLGVGCGRAGSETENVEYFLMLVEGEQYDYIKKLAFSNYASNQLLSVLAIELFEERKKLIVDEELKKRILEIKSSDNSFASCCGCMPCNGGKLKDLLNKKSKNEYLVKSLRRYMKYRLYKK